MCKTTTQNYILLYKNHVQLFHEQLTHYLENTVYFVHTYFCEMKNFWIFYTMFIRRNILIIDVVNRFHEIPSMVSKLNTHATTRICILVCVYLIFFVFYLWCQMKLFFFCRNPEPFILQLKSCQKENQLHQWTSKPQKPHPKVVNVVAYPANTLQKVNPIQNLWNITIVVAQIYCVC